jgi:antibiotic biosynthesis monooxygenase (ABM) superfamily enzyme
MSSRTGNPTAEPAREAPATVVVAQRVKAGMEDEFRRWQDGMNRAVASFSGFLGTEVVPPAGQGGEWTVLYRFASKPSLERWLASPERAAMIDRGEDLFEGPASQQVLIGEREEGSVTVVVSHSIAPDHEEEFREWQRRMTEAESGFAGFRGSQLFPPVPGVQEDWAKVFTFDTDEHLSAWLESSERKRLLDEAPIQDFKLHRVSSPFGSWFSFDVAEGEAPAQWKTALSVLVGLYPTVVLLTLGISEIWPDGKLWETLLLGNVCSVTLLTFVVMPTVTRALGFWLAPSPARSGPRLDALGAVVSVAFVTVAAFIFWLVTTQIWTLP